MKSLNWNIGSFDRGIALDLCRHGVNPLTSVLLASRGVTHFEEAQAVLGETHVETHDPFLLADMEKAVRRIRTAVENGERIAVYGDYDVDGMTSCALLALWLRSVGADFETYIPGRVGEGYGLNSYALDTLKARGVGLVITVDCGVTAIAEAEYARTLGLGLVITDHHECRAQLPIAAAVVDPKRPDCGYPNKALAGVGVAFKLVCALEGATNYDEMLKRYGDLVAIGTIADVMPVLGENRRMIRSGLISINENPRPGLLRLLKEIGVESGRVKSSTVSYMIAPRLNAAGRMSKPELSVELLLTSNEEDAERLAIELCRMNNERRVLETEIYNEAEEMLDGPEPTGPIILARRGWFQGVTGIVAAKLAERYLVPVVIISIDEDMIGRGSCRSYGSFCLYEALKSCDDILDNYGGHEMAAGVTVAENNINELSRRLTANYQDNVESASTLGLNLDFEVEKFELLSAQNIRALERLEPFGNGNPSPCLCIKGAFLASAYSIGAGKHSRLRIEKVGKSLDCVFFSMPTDRLRVKKGTLVDVAFEPQLNEYRGRCDVQLHLTDIRQSGFVSD
ncbi:MAG: single-stranded-DNA-specific exonuclease RecJ [Oscillospiraceae bacterium]|nr:single-stranded-DNA-specific exonuclease RecJ [Oscillospiraceae bacterium]